MRLSECDCMNNVPTLIAFIEINVHQRESNGCRSTVGLACIGALGEELEV